MCDAAHRARTGTLCCPLNAEFLLWCKWMVILPRSCEFDAPRQIYSVAVPLNVSGQIQVDLGQSGSKKVRDDENEDSSETSLQLLGTYPESRPDRSSTFGNFFSSAWLPVFSSYYSFEYFFDPSFDTSIHRGRDSARTYFVSGAELTHVSGISRSPSPVCS